MGEDYEFAEVDERPRGKYDQMVEHLVAGKTLFIPGAKENARVKLYGRIKSEGKSLVTRVGKRDGVEGLFLWTVDSKS